MKHLDRSAGYQLLDSASLVKFRIGKPLIQTCTDGENIFLQIDLMLGVADEEESADGESRTETRLETTARLETTGKIRLTSQDQKFLRALKIAVDDEQS